MMVLALLVLLPVNISGGTLNFLRKELVTSDIDKLSISNVPPKSNRVFLRKACRRLLQVLAVQEYIPSNPNDDDDNVYIDEEAFSLKDVQSEGELSPGRPTLINAFQLIGMSSFLNLSGFFEKEDVSERKIRFTCNLSHSELLERIEDIVTGMGYHVQKKNGRLKVVQGQKDQKYSGNLSVAAEWLKTILSTAFRKKFAEEKQLISLKLGLPNSQCAVCFALHRPLY